MAATTAATLRKVRALTPRSADGELQPPVQSQLAGWSTGVATGRDLHSPIERVTDRYPAGRSDKPLYEGIFAPGAEEHGPWLPY